MKTRLLILIIVIIFSVTLASMNDTYAGAPFERVPISSFGVYSMDENQLNKVEAGQQIMFRSDIENVQDVKQYLVYGVQVFDQNKERVFADWIDTTLEPKSFFSPSVLWTPTVIGNYTATSTVWESMDNPTAFSAVWEIEFEVVRETENINTFSEEPSVYAVPFTEDKSLEENLKENRLPIGKGVYMNFTFFLILLGGGIIFAIKRKGK